jgi:hypothetical protein
MIGSISLSFRRSPGRRAIHNRKSKLQYRNSGWPPDEELDKEPDPLRPSPWRALLQAASLCYDYLGLALIGSFVPFIGLLWFGYSAWAAASSPLLFLLYRFALPILPVYGIMAGPVELAHRITLREDPGALDLLRGWKHFGLRGLALGAINGCVGMILFGDVVFLLSRPQSLLWIVAIPFAYGALFWAASQIYQLPLLIVQGLSPFRSFKQAHLLVLANPGYTAALLLPCVLVAGASLAVVLPLLVAPVWFATVGVVAVRDLVKKYEALDQSA